MKKGGQESGLNEVKSIQPKKTLVPTPTSQKNEKMMRYVRFFRRFGKKKRDDSAKKGQSSSFEVARMD